MPPRVRPVRPAPPALIPLTRGRLVQGVRVLAARDPDLARLAETNGPPPLWSQATGFPTLVHIILGQQVSLASALAAFRALRGMLPRLTPAAFQELDDASLRRAGFSRQKATYCRELASALCERRLRLCELTRASDDSVRSQLVQVKGIGDWTADVYLLMALKRPDRWPPGDIALLRSLQEVKRLPSLPSRETFEELGAAYRPWRSVAARLLWHDYLLRRGRA